MENKKQTAIEWLFEQFNNQDIPFGSYLFKEAKELEKQKMIEFGKKMQMIDDLDLDGFVTFFYEPEKYYKETYEKE